MIKKISTLMLLLSIITIGVNGQTVPSPSETYLNIEVVNPTTLSDEVLDTLTNPMGIVGTNEMLMVSVSMLLEDTTVVSKIHVKLGTTLGGNDLLEQTFNYDENLTLPQSYFREEEMLTIGMGEYVNSGVFYCEVTLEDDSQNQSEVITCQSDQ
tara:strand:- start:545 stop:1006 length:462 start_codon:yes stop_codon:yes gene_type:complete